MRDWLGDLKQQEGGEGNIMKRIVYVMLLVGVIAFAGSAWACDDRDCPPAGIEKTWTAYDNPEPNIFFGVGGVDDYSFTFDIKTDGFTPLVDLVKQYSLYINFADDRDCFLEPIEIAKITDGGHEGYDFFAWDYYRDSVHVSGSSTLNTDGTLLVSIHRVLGDFYYLDARLDAKGCDYESVPEPASLVLLGLGLISLAGIRSRFGK